MKLKTFLKNPTLILKTNPAFKAKKTIGKRAK